MTFTFTAVVKATAAKFNFAACSRHAKCSFRVRLHTKSFLQKKCVTLESLSVAEQQSAKSNNATPKSNNKTSANHFSKDRTLCNASTNKQIQCYMCKEAHGLYQCTLHQHTLQAKLHCQSM
jgi:hypothetical protein